jgi:hypothetical protein
MKSFYLREKRLITPVAQQVKRAARKVRLTTQKVLQRTPQAQLAMLRMPLGKRQIPRQDATYSIRLTGIIGADIFILSATDGALTVLKVRQYRSLLDPSISTIFPKMI